MRERQWSKTEHTAEKTPACQTTMNQSVKRRRRKKKQTKENIDKARLVLVRIHHVDNLITCEQAPDEVSGRARN